MTIIANPHKRMYSMSLHSDLKHTTKDDTFHPGVNRKREGLYLAHDAEAISPTITESPMPITATATALTWVVVILEMAIFLWLFGPWGLLAITITTIIYTLMDKRARTWLSRLAKNNLGGSGG